MLLPVNDCTFSSVRENTYIIIINIYNFSNHSFLPDGITGNSTECRNKKIKKTSITSEKNYIPVSRQK